VATRPCLVLASFCYLLHILMGRSQHLASESAFSNGFSVAAMRPIAALCLCGTENHQSAGLELTNLVNVLNQERTLILAHDSYFVQFVFFPGRLVSRKVRQKNEKQLVHINACELDRFRSNLIGNFIFCVYIRVVVGFKESINE